MTDLTHLVATRLPSSVRLHAGPLPRLTVDSPQGTAEVYFHGAHVTAWRPALATEPVLWMSRFAIFEPGKPIRGGVPICFPWFGPHPAAASAPAHGFARISEWRLVEAAEDASGVVTLAMELAGGDVSPLWPHRFRLTYRITIGAVLRLALEVENAGAGAFTFEEALHSYFAVQDIRGTAIGGLEDTEYIDKVGGLRRARQGPDAIRFAGETDRVYLNTHATCVIDDPGGRRRISIAKTASDSTVVWNPWIDKARAMPDFGEDEWPGMVCVETCNVSPSAVTLA
ncbi:MAG: glucose-6-phosphate 1-epimerase, partial [Acidobacteriota bacterium]